MSQQIMEDISRRIYEFISDAGLGTFPFLPGEETLTEIALVELGRRMPAITVVEKPSRIVESREGHDWVWTVRTARGFGTMRVQAKKLYSSGRYDVLNHHYRLDRRNGIEPYELQLERLIRSAKANGQVPVYAMYNGDFGIFARPTVAMGHCCRGQLQRSIPGRADYSPLGVTLMDAFWVRWWMSPDPAAVPDVPQTSDLNRAAIPWECMFCTDGAREAGGPAPDNAASRGALTGQSVSDEEEMNGRARSRTGLPHHRKSPLLKLLHALEDDDSFDARREDIDGFTVSAPSWLRALEDFSNSSEGLEPESVFRSLEPFVDDDERPDFYVFLDLEPRDEPVIAPEQRYPVL